MSKLLENNGQEQSPRITEEEEGIEKMPRKELVSQACEILGIHTDSDSNKPEKVLSKKERDIIMRAMPFLKLNIRELIYFTFPELTIRTLVEIIPKKLEDVKNESIFKAYSLLHEKAYSKGERIFNDSEWKIIEEAWLDLDPEVKKCALLAFPEFSRHMLSFMIRNKISIERATA